MPFHSRWEKEWGTMTTVEALAGLALVIWIYLLWGRGKFWQASFVLDGEPAHREAWPSVIAIVPARNEANVIRHTLPSLLTQDYPGVFSVILVDDHSDDKTMEQAEAEARRAGGGGAFHGHARRASPPWMERKTVRPIGGALPGDNGSSPEILLVHRRRHRSQPNESASPCRQSRKRRS